MLYKVLNTYRLWKIVIFVIKLNPICASNNPKPQNFFKKSEVRSEGKTLPIAASSFFLDL